MKRNKVALILAMIFFVLITIYSAWNDLSADKQELDNASLVKAQLYKITELNRVVTQLKRERTLTAVYQAAPDKTSLTLLQEQYLVPTKVLTGASHAVDLLTLQQRRKTLQASDLVHADQKATYRTYTELVQQLLFRSEEMVFNTHNNKIKNALITYHLLKNVQENAGQLRAKVGSILANKFSVTQSHQEITAHHSIHYLLLSTF